MAKRPARRAASSRPEARFRLRLSVDRAIAVGPGKIDLLEAIERQGSLTSAAKALDMSYRRAWVLLDELNRHLRTPAVVSSTGGAFGGGSELTPAGRELVSLYRRVERTAQKSCARDLARLIEMLQDAGSRGARA